LEAVGRFQFIDGEDQDRPPTGDSHIPDPGGNFASGDNWLNGVGPRALEEVYNLEDALPGRRILKLAARKDSRWLRRPISGEDGLTVTLEIESSIYGLSLTSGGESDTL
jgi:hypothetical protein